MVNFNNIQQSDLQIVNPVGIDSVIQNMQVKLVEQIEWLDLCFGKAYKNLSETGYWKPMVYIGHKMNDYIEVYPDDKKNFAFFDVIDTSDVSEEGILTTIKNIFFVNLNKSHAKKVHRASEEAIRDVFMVLENYKGDFFEIQKIIRDFKNVYDAYNYELSQQKVDYQPYFVFAIEGIVRYSYSNCNK